MANIVIVVPTYNEEENIRKLLRKLESTFKRVDNYLLKILVVDANSEDRTQTIVLEERNLNNNVFLLTGKKRGIGIDLRRGFDYAVEELGADIIGQIDADFSHNPDDFIKFIEKINLGCELVNGSRYIKGGLIPEDWEIHRKFLSIFGNFIIRILFGTYNITEYTSSFRLFTGDLYRRMDKSKIDFYDNTFLPAFIYEAVRKGARVCEVPIVFRNRKFGESKINVPSYVPNLLKYSISVFVGRIWRR